MIELKTVANAFSLPQGRQVAVYVGSFPDFEKAKRCTVQLAKKNINVTLVDADVVMEGPLLVIPLTDRQTAGKIKNQMATLGLATEIGSIGNPIQSFENSN